MLKHFTSLFILLFVALLYSCGPDYNTDFEPPPPNAQLDDVFPNEIDGMKSSIERLKLTSPIEGFMAYYGERKITIDAILTPNKTVADDYFKEVIVPRIDEMKNHFRGKINGKWRASGTDEDGRKYYAWVNKGWIFMLSGVDNEHLSKAIDAFKYASE